MYTWPRVRKSVPARVDLARGHTVVEIMDVGRTMVFPFRRYLTSGRFSFALSSKLIGKTVRQDSEC